MNEKIYLIPKKDVHIANFKIGGFIPINGAYVDMNRYYQRRIDDGDAKIGKPQNKSRKSNKKGAKS